MCVRVANVCAGELAAADRDGLGAVGTGPINNLRIGGSGWVYYESIAGGQGARPWRDGMSGVHTAMTNTRDTPIEALERTLPLRIRRYALRPDTAAAGSHRGGDGIERDVEVLPDTVVALVT